MGMTITEKIIAAHCGKERVVPGEIVVVDLDRCFTHDAFAASVIRHFKKKASQVWDPDKIILICDHEVPAVSEEFGAVYDQMVAFSKEQGIKSFYFSEGICHQIMPEQGHVAPGEIIIGTDSHTVTYGALTAFSTGIGSKEMANIWATGKIWLRVPETVRFVYNNTLSAGVYAKDIILHAIGRMKADGCNYQAVEFCGQAISDLSVNERLTITNMVVEMGAKNGVIPFDVKTRDWVEQRGLKNYAVYDNDSDAGFKATYEYDASSLEPQVAGPGGVDDVNCIRTYQGIKITQAFLGSCTNGRLEDLREAAKILNGQKVAPFIKLIVTPASKTVYKEAMKEGLIEIFLDAGGLVTNPACGFCMGKLGGVLGKNDVAICSNNRNFKGRLGHRDAQVYLASPAVVAASALKGEISDARSL